MEEYIIYVLTDAMGRIRAVNSSAFLYDASGWIEIGRGTGRKYSHAQGNYFPLPIMTDGGAYRYKLVNGVPAECTAEEIADQEAVLLPNSEPTTDERLTELEEAFYLLLSGVTE